MHSFTKLGFILGGLLSTQAFAATFTMPDYFEMMYVDREDAVLINKQNQVEVSPGMHEVVIRYFQVMEGNDGDNDFFRSQPIIVDLTVTNETNLKLTAKEPESERQAERYLEKPSFMIVNERGEQASYQSEQLPLKQGLQLSRNYLREVEDFKGKLARDNKVAALEAQLVEAKQEVNAIPVDTTALETLKTLYKVVDTDTQTAFKIWIIDSSMMAKEETEKLNILKQHYNKLNVEEQKQMQVWMIK